MQARWQAVTSVNSSKYQTSIVLPHLDRRTWYNSKALLTKNQEYYCSTGGSDASFKYQAPSHGLYDLWHTIIRPAAHPHRQPDHAQVVVGQVHV